MSDDDDYYPLEEFKLQYELIQLEIALSIANRRGMTGLADALRAIGVQDGKGDHIIIGNETAAFEAALAIAAHLDLPGVLTALLSLPAGTIDLNAIRLYGGTPLHEVINPQSARELLEAGADMYAQNTMGFLPIHTAKNVAVAEAILDKARQEGGQWKARNMVNHYQNRHHETALFNASRRGDLAHVELLLLAGANTRIKNQILDYPDSHSENYSEDEYEKKRIPPKPVMREKQVAAEVAGSHEVWERLTQQPGKWVAWERAKKRLQETETAYQTP